jgi:1,4-alpha-glucan branching enzyme
MAVIWHSNQIQPQKAGAAGKQEIRMAASQQHISDSTPMGANLIAGGATFRVWAPRALHVYVALNGVVPYQPQPTDELVKNPATGHWTGFFPGVVDGTKYRFFVVGTDASGFKRDPWARELELYGYPDCDCIVRDPDTYPWHDGHFRPPAFNDLIVYQFHVGVFYARDSQGGDRRPNRVSKFLDVVDRIEYLADLGVNALQPLPLVEFQGEWSLGYNGSDLFSPEMDYCVDPVDLDPYLQKVNALLAKKSCAPLTQAQLSGQVNQLKALIDLCHLYGLAVIPDVVYNHAGGGFDPQSLDYFDFPARPDRHNNLYFSSGEWAGGRVFAFAKPEAQDFLIHNAKMFLEEYHADGLRYDEVSVIDRYGGWFFSQQLTDTLRFAKPRAVQIVEYWGDQPWLAVLRPSTGMGFDIAYSDGIRNTVRGLIADAAGGASAAVQLGRLGPVLERVADFPAAWQVYNCIENHDLILDMDGDHRKPRIAKLAHWDDPRSWYARSRARVATALLLTAPGVPMLFMGQEFLEDKGWSDSPQRADLFLWWEGLDGQDRHMADFHRFTRDLLWLRRRHPALRSEVINVFHINEADRILAFHRWVPNLGRDVVVVMSLREESFLDASYTLGLPQPGRWREVFNSDVYDHFPNAWVHGNTGGVTADGPPRHDFAQSADLTIPANSVLVLAR